MKKGQKCYGYVDGKQYQVLLYPQDYINITQSPYGGYSHQCSKHGGNSGCWDINKTSDEQTELYAPCDCYRVAYLSGEGNGNQCMYQSNDKVIFADGTLDYAFFGFGHDGRSVCFDKSTDYTPKVATTKEFKQGDLMGYTGCYGDDKITGIHSHWIIGRGIYNDEKDTTDAFECCSGSFGHNCVQFISPNPVDIDDMFYANGTQITSSGQQTGGGGATCTWKLFDCGSTPTPTTQYSLTLSASGNGSVSPSGTTYHDKGSKITIKAIANSGATFTKWSDDNTSATRTITLNSNTSLTAYFTGTTPETDKYLVTLNVSPSGSGYTKGQGYYSSGERAYLYAYANEGYKFEKWSDGYTYSDRYWDITSNLTLTAYFKLKTFTISGSVQDDKGNANVGGTISGLGTYNYGTSHTINIQANKHYVIKSIMVNGSEILSTNEQGKLSSYSYNISSLKQDYNIVVMFAKRGILINGYAGIDFQIV